MSPSVLKPTWPRKKFSLKNTPALIKRDIKCLFSSKARAEKRLEVDRQRARLEMKPRAFVVATSAPLSQEQVPQTPVCSPAVPTSPPRTIELPSTSKDTTASPAFDSSSSPFTPPSTAITEYSLVTGINLPTTYDAAMAYFEHWYRRQHPNINIPQAERNKFRGVVIILTIALLKCFKEPLYSPLDGYQPDEYRVPHSARVLEQILTSLTNDRQDAQDLAERILALAGSDIIFARPLEFLERIGYAKTRITDHESHLLHEELHRILCNDLELC